MKSLFAKLSTFAVLSSKVSGHYIFEIFTENGVTYPVYQYIRENTNYNSPVTDLTSTDLRCNVGATGAGTATLAVTAGSLFKFTTDVAVYHQGPVSIYMAKAPTTASDYDGSGQSWFKIKDIGPTFDSTGTATWDLESTYNGTIPASLPNGDYLLRIQQLAIHNPWPAGIPQFYISCAQITVSGGGNGVPSPLVSIPGFISETDPGYTVNIYNNFHNYTVPGPAVWSGASGGIIPPATTLSTVTTKATTVSTSKVSTPTALPTTATSVKSSTTTSKTSASATTTTGTGTGAALYGQCGGIGWTGPTYCAAGTCTVGNAYYSQCLP